MINFHSDSEFFSFFIVFLSGFPLKGCEVLENNVIFQDTVNDFQKFSGESNVCLCPAAAFFDSSYDKFPLRFGVFFVFYCFFKQLST